MKKVLFKIAVAVVVLVMVAIAVLIICLDGVVKKGVETVGPMVTQVDVKLDSAHISILGGSAKLKGFIVGNPQGYKTDAAIKVGNVSVALKPMSVLSDKIVVDSVNVQGPEVTLEGGLKENNLTKILDNVNGASNDTGAKKSDGKSASKKLQVTDFLITGTKVHVNNMLTGGKTMTVAIPDIHLTNLGTGSDGITPAELTKKVMNELMNEIIPAVTKEVSNLGKGAVDAAKNLGGAGKKDVEKVTSGLKGLFKK